MDIIYILSIFHFLTYQIEMSKNSDVPKLNDTSKFSDLSVLKGQKTRFFFFFCSDTIWYKPVLVY
jgi:hypothetical protein